MNSNENDKSIDLSIELGKLKSENERLHRHHVNTNQELSKCINLWCWLIVVGLVVSLILLILSVSIVGIINIERKEFVISAIVVVYIAIFVLLFLARKNPIALIAIISMGLSIASFCLGFTVPNIGKVAQM